MLCERTRSTILALSNGFAKPISFVAGFRADPSGSGVDPLSINLWRVHQRLEDDAVLLCLFLEHT